MIFIDIYQGVKFPDGIARAKKCDTNHIPKATAYPSPLPPACPPSLPPSLPRSPSLPPSLYLSLRERALLRSVLLWSPPCAASPLSLVLPHWGRSAAAGADCNSPPEQYRTKVVKTLLFWFQ